MGLWGNMWGSSGYNTIPEFTNKAAERQKRLDQYKKSWEAYLAELPDPIVIDSAANDNVKVNPARAMVNTGVYFLFGNELKFQDSADAARRFGDQQTSDSSSPNKDLKASDPTYLQKLNKAWKANRKGSFLFNLGLSGAIHGTPFVKILPNAAGINNEYPRLVLLDPANVDVEWDPNDCTKVLKYIIEYITEDANGKPVVRSQEITANQNEVGIIESWSMQDYEQSMTWVLNTGWVPVMEDRTPVGPEEIWPYSWAPVEHCQNLELPHMFWGLPDLDESSVEVIESYQRAMSSLNKIVRIHASPRMFAKNVMPDQITDIDVSADNIITLPNMEADLNVLQTLGNLSPSIQYTDKMMADLMKMMQVPPIALGDFESASTAISGVTLSILYAPLLQKTELKRISYGDMIERINQKMLTLMGFVEDDWENLLLVWPEAMPGSAYLERQTLQQDQQMGASRYTIMSRLGYDPVEEQGHAMKEQEQLLELQKKYAPEPAFGSGKPPGGNNNPAGNGNKNGSMGGTKAAGTPKSPSGSNPTK